MTFNAMLNSPARLSQPHLHPDKINGALWFGIDPSVNSFIRATWQGYYMGPWRVGGRFLMKGGNHGGKGLCKISIGTLEFNDLVYGLWKKETWTTIGERIRKKKRQHKKPNYINDADWTLLLENWRPMQLKRRAKRLQNLASLILCVKILVLVLTVFPFPSQNAKGKRGHVYGLGSAQYREYAPSSRVPNGLARNLELEMRVGGLETSLQSVTADIAEVKQDVSEMKQDFAATRDGINQLLQTLRPQQAPTGQTSAQPQAPTTQS
uniref:Uncharacterized protein n=1 Tax=Brassica oleracea TaxID=3712 RepID=A0A3P6CT78_BRAOL|nr:unnamed protein product [Brassica oleracea]